MGDLESKDFLRVLQRGRGKNTRVVHLNECRKIAHGRNITEWVDEEGTRRSLDAGAKLSPDEPR